MSIKRTNSVRPDSATNILFKTAASWAEFLASNRLMVLFTLIFLAGVLFGIVLYGISGYAVESELGTIFRLHAVIGGLRGAVSVLFSSSFSAMLLLAVLFICGLSACGALLAAVVPLFFGMGLGMTEAFFCAGGLKGFVISSILIAPHCIIAAVALIFASMESIRMSLLFSRQLLPNSGIGGLWQDFKLYCVRFLLFVCLAFASGILDVCMRLLFAALLLE